MNITSGVVQVLITVFTMGLLAAGYAYVADTDSAPSKDSSVSDFDSSIMDASRAIYSLPRDFSVDTGSAKDVASFLQFSASLLERAARVDIDELNTVYATLGQHYNDEFINGFRLLARAIEEKDPKLFLQGQNLIMLWGEWFNANQINIENAQGQ